MVVNSGDDCGDDCGSGDGGDSGDCGDSGIAGGYGNGRCYDCNSFIFNSDFRWCLLIMTRI